MYRLVSWQILVVGVACTRGEERPSSRVSSTEAFAFRSPTIGDTLVEGRTYTIRWVSTPARRINLGAAMGGHDKGLLLADVPPGLDSLVWTVPIGFVTGFGPFSSNQIRPPLGGSSSHATMEARGLSNKRLKLPARVD